MSNLKQTNVVSSTLGKLFVFSFEIPQCKVQCMLGSKRENDMKTCFCDTFECYYHCLKSIESTITLEPESMGEKGVIQICQPESFA